MSRKISVSLADMDKVPVGTMLECTSQPPFLFRFISYKDQYLICDIVYKENKGIHSINSIFNLAMWTGHWFYYQRYMNGELKSGGNL